MQMKPINDKRSVKLENVMARNYIPFLEGRPEREEQIRMDDILNLKIALNNAKSLEEFLTQV